jgi:hypothetical protein
MPRKIVLAWVVCVVLCTLGCGSDDEKNQEPEAAKQLLDRIQEEDYRTWARAPGYAERMPTLAPHGDAVDIYVNPVTAAALAGPSITAWPQGSIIAKDGWKSDGQTLEVIAVMEKRTDGWFWAEYSGSGSALYSGRPSVCTGCHDSGADYVRAFGFP